MQEEVGELNIALVFYFSASYLNSRYWLKGQVIVVDNAAILEKKKKKKKKRKRKRKEKRKRKHPKSRARP